jgi:hypothetical protein
MARRTPETRIRVRDSVGDVLMLRSAADALFRSIASSAQTRVVLDFSEVEFMSRSFADEYLSAKSKSRKLIVERGVQSDIRRMLDLVARQIKSAPARSELLDKPVKHAPAVAF